MTTTPDRRPVARSRNALWLGLGLGGTIILLFVLGKTGVLGSLEAFIGHMQDLADTPWALPAVIALFTGAAFVGLPQFGLIGAAVVAFGPVNGALYSWLATLVSGSVTFWIGRFSGEAAVARFSGRRASRFTDFVSRNAFAASLIVRNVPICEHGLWGCPGELFRFPGRDGDRLHSKNPARHICGPESHGSHCRLAADCARGGFAGGGDFRRTLALRPPQAEKRQDHFANAAFAG